MWEGSASQVAVGFVVTLTALVGSLALDPFAHRELGYMHAISLLVQAATLLSGLMIITQR